MVFCGIDMQVSGEPSDGLLAWLWYQTMNAKYVDIINEHLRGMKADSDYSRR